MSDQLIPPEITSPVYPKEQVKIIPRILGGLGNQLFCYSAARRLALANRAELIIDDVSGFVRDLEYRRHYQLDHFNIPCRKATPAERLEPVSRLRRFLKREINNRRPFEARSYIQQEGLDYDSRLRVLKPRGSVYLEGYWQSEQYFKDIESVIRTDLTIIPPEDEKNLATAEFMSRRSSVAVHVRFFDAPREIGLNNAPRDYYSRAVVQMETLATNAHYFVFSDRPQAARARVPLPDNRVTVISHNQGDEHAYADLWLMKQCQHFIIANSTFSWWGAWLSDHSEKKVIAPGFSVRDGKMAWGFRGLLPAEWIKLL